MNSQSEPNTKLMNLKKSYRYKVVLIGDQAVGKSSIISRYISDEFEELHNVSYCLSSQQLASTSCRSVCPCLMT